MKPEFINFSPSEGFPNDTVKIYGKNFGTDRYNIFVKFGVTLAEIISCENDSLKVRVPWVAAGDYKIKLKINSYLFEFSNTYNIIAKLPFHKITLSFSNSTAILKSDEYYSWQGYGNPMETESKHELDTIQNYNSELSIDLSTKQNIKYYIDNNSITITCSENYYYYIDTIYCEIESEKMIIKVLKLFYNNGSDMLVSNFSMESRHIAVGELKYSFSPSNDISCKISGSLISEHLYYFNYYYIDRKRYDTQTVHWSRDKEKKLK